MIKEGKKTELNSIGRCESALQHKKYCSKTKQCNSKTDFNTLSLNCTT